MYRKRRTSFPPSVFPPSVNFPASGREASRLSSGTRLRSSTVCIATRLRRSSSSFPSKAPSPALSPLQPFLVRSPHPHLSSSTRRPTPPPLKREQTVAAYQRMRAQGKIPSFERISATNTPSPESDSRSSSVVEGLEESSEPKEVRVAQLKKEIASLLFGIDSQALGERAFSHGERPLEEGDHRPEQKRLTGFSSAR